MLVVGTVHFGTVLVARHRVTDAANFATRAAAVSGVVAPGPIQAQVLARLGAGANSCATLTVTPTLVADPNGFNVLNVDVTCDLAPTPGAPLLGAVGPESFTVTAAMGKRLPGCDSVNTFVVAVLVLQETGGNLISVIDRIVDNARSAASYRGRLNALTSEGRTSAKLLAALPVGFALLAGSADTGYADFFLSDSTGRALGVFALLWWLTGILFTRRLVKAAS